MGIYSAFTGLNALLDTAGFTVNKDVEGVDRAQETRFAFTDFAGTTSTTFDSNVFANHNLTFNVNLFCKKEGAKVKEEVLSESYTDLIKTIMNLGRDVSGVINAEVTANEIAFQTDHEYISGAIVAFNITYRENIQS